MTPTRVQFTGDNRASFGNRASECQSPPFPIGNPPPAPVRASGQSTYRSNLAFRQLPRRPRDEIPTRSTEFSETLPSRQIRTKSEFRQRSQARSESGNGRLGKMDYRPPRQVAEVFANRCIGISFANDAAVTSCFHLATRWLPIEDHTFADSVRRGPPTRRWLRVLSQRRSSCWFHADRLQLHRRSRRQAQSKLRAPHSKAQRYRFSSITALPRP